MMIPHGWATVGRGRLGAGEGGGGVVQDTMGEGDVYPLPPKLGNCGLSKVGGLSQSCTKSTFPLKTWFAACLTTPLPKPTPPMKKSL